MYMEFPVEMALLDFLPVFLFAAGALLISGILRKKVGMGYAVFAGLGTAIIFVGGFLRALWKLLEALAVPHPNWIGEIQFHTGALGFLVLLVCVARLLWTDKAMPAALLMAPERIPYLVATVLFSILMEAGLTVYAFRKGARTAGILLVLAVIFLLAMGGVSGGEQTVDRDRIGQTINTFGQTFFLLGMWLLYKKVAR